MEVVIFVSEAELGEFPEEVLESTEPQEQSNTTSQLQGTLKSLLSVDTSTPKLLDRICRGKIAHLLGESSNLIGGSDSRPIGYKAHKRSTSYHCNKQPRLLVSYRHPRVCKQPGYLYKR